ncbi:MAG: tetratricopeptide repeat protein, partial [Planctomycetes bacterium]|nr:tetratricopeptide repeat protein [Planctomycetota bacterium]
RPAMSGASHAQLAFATFMKGAVLQAQGKRDPAKEQFLASLKAFDAGTWHDETLYRLATMIQDLADKSEIANPKSEIGGDKPLSPKEKEAREKAGEERLAAFVKSKAAALPYWQELVRRYGTKDKDGKLTPHSPRVEEALYRIGVIMAEQAGVAPEDKAEQAWKEANAALKRFCETYPKSLYVGDAYLRQMDIALERMFDLEMAQTLAPQAAQWASAAVTVEKAEMPALFPWASLVPRPEADQIKQTVYECFLRAGLAAYLAGQFDQAVDWISLAGPKSPGVAFTEKPDMESFGLYYLLKAIRSKKPLTEQQALDAAKTDQQRLAIQLADLYMETIRPEKAEEIFNRIINHDLHLGKVPPNLEGYAILQIATSLDRQEGRRPEALERLKTLAGRRDLQGTYWGGCGLFRLALFTYNQTQDPKKSLPLYEAMLKQYPNHQFGELAHLYYCLDAMQLKDNALAEKASQEFFQKYPGSEYRALLQQRLNTLASPTP